MSSLKLGLSSTSTTSRPIVFIGHTSALWTFSCASPSPTAAHRLHAPSANGTDAEIAAARSSTSFSVGWASATTDEGISSAAAASSASASSPSRRPLSESPAGGIDAGAAPHTECPSGQFTIGSVVSTTSTDCAMMDGSFAASRCSSCIDTAKLIVAPVARDGDRVISPEPSPHTGSTASSLRRAKGLMLSSTGQQARGRRAARGCDAT
mmetsp:Transcript_27405/g.72133  ORF Transcript_27405/g.72133 Transcript_27405/m.72133 type:complete len:209 (+) Transcript_27405:583-1209(+)